MSTDRMNLPPTQVSTDEVNLLLESTVKNSQIDFKDQTFLAKCVKVYDGDTIHIDTFFPSWEIVRDCLPKDMWPKSIFRFKCRLGNIDAPEIRSKKEEEKKAAIEARDYLSGRILGKIIRCHCHTIEKWGRLLCEIYDPDTNECYNTTMINLHYAKEYHGGKKEN